MVRQRCGDGPVRGLFPVLAACTLVLTCPLSTAKQLPVPDKGPEVDEAVAVESKHTLPKPDVSAAQAVGIASLAAMPGRPLVAVGNFTKTPVSVQPVGWRSQQKTIEGAAAEFVDRFWADVETAFSLLPEDSFEVSYLGGPKTGEPRMPMGKAVFKRLFDGVPVEGDHFILSFIEGDEQGILEVVGIDAHVVRELAANRVPMAVVISDDTARAAFEALGPVHTEPALRYITDTGKPELTFKARVGKDEGGREVYYEVYLRATDGVEVYRRREMQDLPYSKDIAARVSNPHDPFPEPFTAGKRLKALPFAVVSDRAVIDWVVVESVLDCGCVDFPTRTQFIMDSDPWIFDGHEHTSYQGHLDFSTSDPDAFLDNNAACGRDSNCAGDVLVSEAVDVCCDYDVHNFRYSLDLGQAAPSVAWVSGWVPTPPPPPYPDPIWPGRRMETFALLNVAAHYWHEQLGLPVYHPLYYTYRTGYGLGDCSCAGAGGHGSLNITCGDDNPDPGLASCTRLNEINEYRHIIFHEMGHNLHSKLVESHNGGYIHGCYETYGAEGMVNYFAGTMSAMESVNEDSYEQGRVGFARQFPDDDLGDVPNSKRSSFRTIFTSILMDYRLYFGYIADVSAANAIPHYQGEEPIVGICTSTSCDPDSFYAKVNAEAGNWPGGMKQRYEVSRAFHNHVKDAYPAVEIKIGSIVMSSEEPNFNNLYGTGCSNWCQMGGEATCYSWHTDSDNDSFAYLDDVTDYGPRAPIVPTETAPERTTSYVDFPVLEYGPDWGLPFLWFTDTADEDKWTVLMRPGETYTIWTEVSGGADTVLKVQDVDWHDAAINDDCSGGPVAAPASCILNYQWNGTEPRLHRILVHTKTGKPVGPSAHYKVHIRKLNDDYSGNSAFAHPVSLDQAWRYGRIETSYDEDWFYFELFNNGLGTRPIGFAFCAPGNPNAMIEIRRANNTIVQSSHPTSNCETQYVTTSSESPGFFRVRVWSSATGAYKFRLVTTINDVSTSPGNPFNLSAVSGYPSNSVTMIPSAFESTNDVDWFKFWAAAGQIIHLETFGQTGTSDTVLELRPPPWTFCGHNDPETLECDSATDGNTLLILNDDDGGALASSNRDSSIVFVAPWYGYYSVKVSPYSSSNIGGYVLAYFKQGTLMTPEYLLPRE